MGDLAIIEKYPDSWRLDHSDFGDVRATTYAKGVIREFAKIADDPIQVRSMVKVDVEGKGVSGFLPILYHPKAQYWDDVDKGIIATKFYEDAKYFERSWMSFRVGDEVRVMIRDGKPYAVVGFYDGVPRIGENIIKRETGDPYWLDCDKRADYLFQDYGPDVRPLKLLRPCERILINETTNNYSDQDGGYLNSFGYYRLEKVESVYSGPSAPVPAGWRWVEQLRATLHKWISGEVLVSETEIKDISYRYLIGVGPILYLLDTKTTRTKQTYSSTSVDEPELDQYNIVTSSSIRTDYFLYGVVEYPDNVTNFYSLVNSYLGQTFPNPPTSPPPNSYDVSTGDNGMFAAIYTKELYDKAKNGKAIPSEFVRQTNFPSITPNLNGVDDPDLGIFVRPHTKAELQAAGMWPNS